MEQYFRSMVEAGIGFEVHESLRGSLLFGLRWGEGTAARTLGFKRNSVIKALNWADKNPSIALKILGFTS